MSEAAAPHWDTLVAALIELDVLSAADGVSLAEFAEAMAEAEELKAQIAKEGRTFQGFRAGSLIANPLCGVLHQVRERILKYAREFGLTPAARARVHSNETDAPTDEKSDLLRGVG
jgi:P27 family predicted phage terminase small subunit